MTSFCFFWGGEGLWQNLPLISGTEWRQLDSQHPTLGLAFFESGLNFLQLFSSNATVSHTRQSSRVIFCNHELHKLSINIAHPHPPPASLLQEIDCLSFQAGGRSIPRHKYLLSLRHPSPVKYFQRTPAWPAPTLSFQRTDHRRADPAVSPNLREKRQLIREPDRERRGMRRHFKRQQAAFGSY